MRCEAQGCLQPLQSRRLRQRSSKSASQTDQHQIYVKKINKNKRNKDLFYAIRSRMASAFFRRTAKQRGNTKSPPSCLLPDEIGMYAKLQEKRLRKKHRNLLSYLLGKYPRCMMLQNQFQGPHLSFLNCPSYRRVAAVPISKRTKK